MPSEFLVLTTMSPDARTDTARTESAADINVKAGHDIERSPTAYTYLLR